MKTKFPLLFWFILFNLIVFVVFEIFYLLTLVCHLPIGFIFTVLGYLLNVIGVFVVATTAGMLLSIFQKKAYTELNKKKPNNLYCLIFLFVSFILQVSILYLQFNGEISYILILSLPALLIAILVFFLVGKKTIH